MKILFFLLLPSLLFSQINGIVYFNKDMVVNYDNQKIINYYKKNINLISSVNGREIIGIPIQKEFKKETKGIFINGYFTQFLGNSNNLSLKQIKTKFIVFDFHNKIITKIQNENNDLLDWQRPDDIYNKIKNKLKKVKVDDKKIGRVSNLRIINN